MEILRIDAALEQKQLDRLAAAKARRDDAAVEQSLAALRTAADADENLMPLLVDAARAGATEGEIVEALQEVFGKYRETPVF
jgi:methylmalonyl-CoA mutase N-terminal domain/subunit